MDIPGVLKLLELSACGREVTERAAEGALQKAKGLKWLRHCAWTMAKGTCPRLLKGWACHEQKSAGECPILPGVAAGELTIQLPLPHPFLQAVQVAPFEGPSCSCCCST